MWRIRITVGPARSEGSVGGIPSSWNPDDLKAGWEEAEVELSAGEIFEREKITGAIRGTPIVALLASLPRYGGMEEMQIYERTISVGFEFSNPPSSGQGFSGAPKYTKIVARAYVLDHKILRAVSTSRRGSRTTNYQHAGNDYRPVR